MEANIFWEFYIYILKNPFIAKQFIAVGINSPIQAGLDQLLSRQAILHSLHCRSRRQLFQSAIFSEGRFEKVEDFQNFDAIILLFSYPILMLSPKLPKL